MRKIWNEPYNKKVPSPSVLWEVLQDMLAGRPLSFEGLVLLARHACFLSYVHFVRQGWHFRTI